MIDPNERLHKDHPVNGNALLYLQKIQERGKRIGDKPFKQWQIDNIDHRHDNGCPALTDGVCNCAPDLYIPDARGGKNKY